MERINKDITKALKLAMEAHAGQKDKSGEEYFLHPVTVSMTLAKNGYSDNCITTAILHDVVEDTHYSIDDISDIGFDKEVITALTLLTHDKAVPYFEYIEKIRTNEIARAVKMADLLHNMDTSRLKVIGEKDRARLEKYHKSYEILQRS